MVGIFSGNNTSGVTYCSPSRIMISSGMTLKKVKTASVRTPFLTPRTLTSVKPPQTDKITTARPGSTSNHGHQVARYTAIAFEFAATAATRLT